MSPRTRTIIGNVFLVFTIIATTVAISNGGLWWAAVTCGAAITLWGIGTTKNKQAGRR